MCREAGPEFLSALTSFVNLVLASRCPLNVAPVFFGGASWPWTRSLVEFDRLSSASPWDIWYPNVPIFLAQINYGPTFILTNLVSVRLVDVKWPFIRHIGTSKLCRLIMCWWNLILQTRLIVYTDGRCCFLYITEFPSSKSTHIVDQLTVSLLACSLAPTSFSPRRVPSKVIRLGHCYLATPFILCCHR